MLHFERSNFLHFKNKLSVKISLQVKTIAKCKHKEWKTA